MQNVTQLFIVLHANVDRVMKEIHLNVASDQNAEPVKIVRQTEPVWIDVVLIHARYTVEEHHVPTTPCAMHKTTLLDVAVLNIFLLETLLRSVRPPRLQRKVSQSVDKTQTAQVVSLVYLRSVWTLAVSWCLAPPRPGVWCSTRFL